jgi:hypothetical protein
MSYKDNLPDFLSKPAVNYVNKRFDITNQQYNKLKEIEEELKIPASAIIRLALNTFLPKLRDEGFKYGGIKQLWDRNKF